LVFIITSRLYHYERISVAEGLSQGHV